MQPEGQDQALTQEPDQRKPDDEARLESLRHQKIGVENKILALNPSKLTSTLTGCFVGLVVGDGGPS